MIAGILLWGNGIERMPNRKLSGAEVSGTDSANTTVGHDRGASPDGKLFWVLAAIKFELIQ